PRFVDAVEHALELLDAEPEAALQAAQGQRRRARVLDHLANGLLVRASRSTLILGDGGLGPLDPADVALDGADDLVDRLLVERQLAERLDALFLVVLDLPLRGTPILQRRELLADLRVLALQTLDLVDEPDDASALLLLR